MSSFTSNVDESGYGNAAYAGGGAFGSGFMWILVVIVVLWILFRDGFGKDGHRDEFNGLNGCLRAGCKPVFDDESNYQEERNIDNKICCESDKTRSLITHEAELTRGQEFIKTQMLLAEKNAEISNLKQSMMLDAKLDAKFGKVFGDFDKLQCEVSHLPHSTPCFVEARPVALQQCFSEPRRCDRE